MSVRSAVCFGVLTLIPFTGAHAQSVPNVSQVLIYSATNPTASGVYSETGAQVELKPLGPYVTTGDISKCDSACQTAAAQITTGANYGGKSFASLLTAINTSIATALSIVPLASPASGVIERKDPETGAELAESSTLGPIFTERAETIGKGRFYVGFSNQDFHFTRYNGTSLNGLNIFLNTGGQSTGLTLNGTPLTTVPATASVGMDVRLSQDITFLTYGVTDRFDVSVGLPIVHAAVAARTWNALVYAGNGYATNGSTCWCVTTLTPGAPLLEAPQIGQASYGKTGFGDLLVRAKGTVLRRRNAAMAIGVDVRAPTGNEANYLGVGAASVKPFFAVSLYSKPFRNGVVLSPHLDVGWQITGKSILAGDVTGTSLANGVTGAPYSFNKNYVPDVFSWAIGVEAALGRRNTILADVFGNEIGWIHGIRDTNTLKVPNQLPPTGPNGGILAPVGQPVTVSGLVDGGRVSYGQYSGAFGYKARVAGNLIAYFDALVRFDNNGLTARFTPLFGLGYSF